MPAGTERSGIAAVVEEGHGTFVGSMLESSAMAHSVGVGQLAPYVWGTRGSVALAFTIHRHQTSP